MSDATKQPDKSTVNVNHWGFTLFKELANFLELCLKSDRPMTTTINCAFPDMPDVPVLHLWATTDDKSPVVRCREVAAERNEAEAQRDELLAACKLALYEVGGGTKTQDFGEACRLRNEAERALRAALARAGQAVPS